MATNYTPQIKKNILKQLMFSMYSDARIIYREYVQNAFDSINKAVVEGLLSQTKDGFVDIEINRENRKIEIKDNGTGIPCQLSESVLLDVSRNDKDGINQAGFYGIGRLVGAGFCHKLIFETSYYGEKAGTKIELDVDLATKLLDDNDDYLASEVLSKIATKSNYEEEANKHYFVVSLEQVKSEYNDLLDKQEVVNYLNEVAPVEFRDEFDNNVIYDSVEKNVEFKNRMNLIKKVQVIVNGHRIQKQYGLSVTGTGDDIEGIEFFQIRDQELGELAWGWYALTKFSIQIPSTDSLAGIRLRKHNIQIGDRNLLTGRNYWSEERGNSYFYGELHITHNDLYPNAARDGLADTPTKRRFIAHLKNQFAELTKLYKKANEAKVCIKSMTEGVDIIKKKQELTPEAKDKIDNKGRDKFQKLIKTHSQGPVHNMLELYKDDWNDVNRLVEETKAEISKNTSSEIIERKETVSNPVVNSISGNTSVVSENPKKDSVVVPKNNGQDSQTSFVFSMNGNDDGKENKEKTGPLLSNVDLAPLENLLSPEEIWLLRRVFRSLTKNCPKNDHDAALVNQLKKLVVKDLVNEAGKMK